MTIDDYGRLLHIEAELEAWDDFIETLRRLNRECPECAHEAFTAFVNGVFDDITNRIHEGDKAA